VQKSAYVSFHRISLPQAISPDQVRRNVKPSVQNPVSQIPDTFVVHANQSAVANFASVC